MERPSGSRAREIPIVSVVGWSGSGKTTLIGGLIASFAARGLRAGAVKSTHREVELDREGSDSAVFTAAGADRICLVSRNRTYLFLREKPESAEELRGLFPRSDLILCEGLVVEGSLVVEVTGGPAPKGKLKFPVETLSCLVINTDTSRALDAGQRAEAEHAASRGIPIFRAHETDRIRSFLEERIWKEK